MATTAARTTRGQRLHDLAAELFDLPRSIAGPAFRLTLDALEEACGGEMTRHRFATGERVLDWEIPREWHLREAWLRDPAGRTILELADSNLHVVSHSCGVRRRLGLDELQGHLHSLPDQPDAVPYRTTYYADGWGLCLADRVRSELVPGEYEVCIDAELVDGHVELGEVVIPGRRDEEVLFSTYCCHPSMANNELSGPVVVAALAAHLRARPSPPRLTYRLLFLPETIGAISYLSRFGGALRERLVAGWVVTCVGSGLPLVYRHSRRDGTLADRATRHVLRHREAAHRVIDFFPPTSDERQYGSPGFDLPVGCLMRGDFGEWPEYHTSLDDLDFITPGALADSLDLCLDLVEALEADERMRVTVAEGEPQLGRRGLYPTTGGAFHAEAARQELEDMLFLLNFLDGTPSLLAAAERSGRPIGALATAAARLRGAGLLVDAEGG